MAGATISVAIAAEDAVITARSHLQAVLIPATARENAMRASAILLAKDRSFCPDATEIQLTFGAGATVFELGASATASDPVTDSDLSVIATAFRAAIRIDTSAN